ncbi:MAG: hypothetical protein JJU15_06465 [Pararhodobacter sp.]|nr:hypothetical protein [Pararhodobacter sp.]
MTRHILDRPREDTGARLAQFLSLERADQPHSASRLLHQRKREANAPRLSIYTRIERNTEG